MTGFSIVIDSSVTPSGMVTRTSSTGSKPYARYSGTPGSVAIRDRRVKPSPAAASSHASRIRRPSPRRVQSARVNIARTLAGSVAGSSSRASPSLSPLPV